MSLFSSTGDAATRFQSVAESAQAPIKNLLNLIGIADDNFNDHRKDKKNEERLDGRSQEAQAQQNPYQYADEEARSGASTAEGSVAPYDGTPRVPRYTNGDNSPTPTLAPASLDDWREGNNSPLRPQRPSWGRDGTVPARTPPFRQEEDEVRGKQGMVLSSSADGLRYVDQREREQVRSPSSLTLSLTPNPTLSPALSPVATPTTRCASPAARPSVKSG